MLLALSITFNFHYNIWGCMCSTGPFKYKWLKGYIYSSCHYHHQIGSIQLSHCYHIFRGCVPEMFVTSSSVTFCIYVPGKPRICFFIIVQFMMNANSRIPFALQIVIVCLYSTPSHYHHCANLSEDIEHINACQTYFVECVSKIKHILLVIHFTIHYTICRAVCFQFTHSPCDDGENIYTLSYLIIIIKS